jgi:hypothetical protein
MPLKTKPTLDDLCAAMSRFLVGLEQADLDTLAELFDRVSVKPGKASALAPSSWPRSTAGTPQP